MSGAVVMTGGLVGITELLVGVAGEEEPNRFDATTLHVIVCAISVGISVV